MTGVGVVGLGLIARHYLAALERRPGVSLRAVCDVDEAKLSPFAGGQAFATAKLSELLDRDDVGAVIVNAPNDVHHAICSAALEAGKHVCCEKPLALTPGEADDLAGLAARHGARLFTAFHRRYNRHVAALLARTRGRGRGPIRSVRVRYFERIREHCGPDAWYLDPARCGGGALADNGPNALDLLRLFLGELRVERAVLERNAVGVDIRARLELSAPESGAAASVELDWDYPRGELKDIEVVTSDGVVDQADMLEGFAGFKSSLGHEYAAALSDFLAHADAGGAPSRDGPDGVALTHLVARAYEVAEAAPEIRFGDGR